MRPLGGHVIRRLPGFLPDEMAIPGTPLPTLPLLPIRLDLDVGNGGQDAGSILREPLHIIACVSHLPYYGQSKSSKEQQTDRKSTRLNSSHEWISYAVFCLKK